MREIQVIENVLKLNDEVAGQNRRQLQAAGVFSLNLIGSPGCGKTALLEKTLQRLAGRLRAAVVVGDLATSRDGQRLGQWCEHVVQINTGKACHLEAHQVQQALGRLDLAALDLLIIENVGNLICPVGYDLGQDRRVALFSLTEGDDKAAKHPHVVQAADLILLNKMDLAPYLSFNRSLFTQDVRALNQRAPLLEVSAAQGQLEPWLDWLFAQPMASQRAAAVV